MEGVSVWCYLKFEAQFMKKLSNTEAGLKKNVAYKKKRVLDGIRNCSILEDDL